ncbi:MAG: cytidine deaminase [Bdellovibrionales bacterium]
MKVSKDVEKAYKKALSSRSHSHSPYSRFKVGAAVKVRGEDLPVGGCNVENASYGATICAERVALHAAVSLYGGISPEFIVVVTGEKKATVPCALCLQVMAEFCADDCEIYLGNEKEILKKYTMLELLPHPFRQFKADKK